MAVILHSGWGFGRRGDSGEATNEERTTGAQFHGNAMTATVAGDNRDGVVVIDRVVRLHCPSAPCHILSPPPSTVYIRTVRWSNSRTFVTSAV